MITAQNVEIMVPLKHFSSFWRTFEIPQINCESNLILTWPANCVIVFTAVANQGATFAITDTKTYVPAVALVTQGNVKLVDQLELSFKRTINRNKFQSKEAIQAQNQYLDFLIDPSLQGVNRLFVLSFPDNAH